MNILLFRMGFALLAALAVGSVLHVLFPLTAYFPFFAIAFSVTLVLMIGFIEALPSIIIFGLLIDAVSLGRIGMLPAFMVTIAYAGSFLSRRFVLEHGFSTHLFSGALVSTASLLYPFFPSIVLLDPNVPTHLFSWAGSFFVTVGSFISLFGFRFMFGKLDSWTAYMDPQGNLHNR